MWRFAPYVLKTLCRHRARTLLTVSGAAVALFVFCFVGAIQEGLNALRQQAEQSLIVFQAHKFCPATSHLPQDYQGPLARIAGVREVVPIQVFTNNCRASLDVVVFYGLPAEKVRQVRDFKLLSGNWTDFERHQDAAIVGRAVAKRRRIKPGGKFSLGGITVSVTGLFACDNTAEENYIYTHLDFLQRRHGQDAVGRATQFEVLLQPGVDAEAKCREIDDTFRTGSVATTTRPKSVFQANSLGDMTELIGLTHYVAYACVGLVLALVATTTFMSVQDRVHEHAVLQTLGFSGPRIFRLVMAESVLLGVTGGGMGVGLAMAVLIWTGLSFGAEAVTIVFTPSPRLAIFGLALSLVTGIAAGLIPAWQAARAEIVPALRQG